MKTLKRAHKVLSILSSMVMLVQPLIPAFQVIAPQVYAQEVTPTDTAAPTPTDTVAPTDTGSPTPTDTISPAPTDTIAPTPADTTTPSVTPEVTSAPTPTDDTTPTVTPDVTQPSTPNGSANQPTGPPQHGDLLPEAASTEAAPSVTPTVAPEPVDNGHLETSLLDNTQAATLDLGSVDASSATLTTDKADYSPTDTALITGTGFLANHTYSLNVRSSDAPATSTTVDIKTGDDGSFVYAYQLDGNYRQYYSVVLKYGITTVATTSFTDSPPSGCSNDSAGANDVSGQKDLSKMCADYTLLPTSVGVTWDWDDTGWNGANTGDACALFDTNGNGKANYAVCVQVHNTPAAFQTQIVYSCDDSSTTNCLSPTVISPVTTSCTASVQSATDPFPTGNDYNKDTVASCTVKLSDVGGGSAVLTDVCSYPSASTPSNASDCIQFKSNSGKLEVLKSLSPSNDVGKFNLQIDGSTIVSDVGNGGDTGEQVVSVANHTIGEIAGTGTSLSNYSATALCKDVHGTGSTVSLTGTGPWTLAVADGKDILCTITNTRANNASITIIKDAVPNDAQDFAFTTTGTGLSSFSLDDDADATLSNTKVFSNLASGTYSVTEGAVAGWTQTSAVCSDSSPVSTISLSAGENVTCTFTNTKQATVVIQKNTTGGNGTFNFTTTGGNGLAANPAVTTVAGTGSQSYTVTPGISYSVAETVPSGWSLTNSSCTSGTPASFTPTAGQTVTCTFANSKKPTLAIYKVCNPTGDTGTFNLQIDGTNVTTGTICGGWTNGPIEVSIGSHTVGEAGANLSNYTSVITGDCAANGTVSLAAGENKTCTITNTRLPKLTVTKVVTNDNGGSKVVSDFPLFVDGNAVTSGVKNTSTIGAHVITETSATGYTGTFSGDCDATGHVTLAAGDDKACTLTNDDNPAHLIVIKHVVKDNGGTAVAGDFTMTINSVAATGGNSFAGVESPGTNKTLTTVGSYSVTESGPAGYADSYSADCTGSIALGETKTCTITNDDVQPKLTVTKVVQNNHGGTKVVADFPLFVGATGVTSGAQNSFDAGTYTVSETGLAGYTGVISGDCAANGSITLHVGDTKSCTITNSDVQPQLKVVKVVTNDNGGKAVISDFTLKVNDTTVTSGDANSFDAGSYVVSETGGPSGYTGTLSGACDANGNVTLAVGEALKTCTITNDDQPGTLIVKKVVINDDGGSATPSSFGFKVNGGSTIPFDDDGQNDLTKDAGVYTVTEPTAAGYSTSYDNCSEVTVPNGGTQTCTITNDDIAPTLKLVKHVTNNNGGDKAPKDWTLTATGTNGFSDSGDSVTFHTVTAGVGYVLSESAVGGYDAGSWSCSAGSLDGSTISLGLDQHVTCSITNDDQVAHLIVKKHVINNNGGSKLAGNFTMNVTGTHVSDDSFAGDEDGTNITLDAGSYSVDESTSSGYTKSLGEDCSGTIANGQTKTCTVTNDDQPAILIVKKHVVNDNGGSKLAGNFTMNVTGTNVAPAASFPGDEDGTTVTLNAGTFSVGEDSVYGYAKSLGENCSGDIANGQTKTCTVTNNDIAPTLTLVKTVINDNGGTKHVADFVLKIDSTTVTSGQAKTLNAGSYTASEISLAGYSPSTWGNDCATDGSVTLNVGDNLTCTIVNDDIKPTLKVVKVVVNDNKGTKEVSDFPLFVDATSVTSGDTNSFDAGSYTVSETNQTGYVGTISGDCSTKGEVTLAVGDSLKTCTITNDDVQPKLTVTKVVINRDGGTEEVASFPLFVGDTGVTSGVQNGFDAGTYIVNETNKPGYASTISGDCNPETGSVTLAVGDVKACTITNDDIAPRLTVNKVVVPSQDNGAFNLLIDEHTYASNIGDGGTTDAVALHTGSHTVSETAGTETSLSDYTSVISGDCDTKGDITLALADDKTCTITNTKKGHIIVHKVTQPTIGDEKSFSVTATGEGTIDGNATRSIFDGSTVNYEVTPGSYAVGEQAVEGWDITGNSCTELTVTAGQTVDCTITNTQRGQVKVFKFNDVNGNGVQDEGENTLSDWTINLSGNESDTTNNNGFVVFNNVLPGSHDLSENQQDNWKLTGISCSNDQTGESGPSGATGSTGASGSTGATGETGPSGATGATGPTAPEIGLCHWNEGADKWNALSVPPTNNGHEGHVKDFPYAGPYDLHGQSGKLADDWCAANDPGLQTFTWGVSKVSAVALDVPQSHDVHVDPGEHVTCYIGNQLQNPILTITKTNDAVGDQSPGGHVNFTITVTATQSAAYNVQVVDLPSKGFNYHAGSATAHSSVRGDLLGALTHVYASPGIWSLGNMVIGETVTLTYQTDIDGNQKPGLYKDLALAYGCKTDAACAIGDAHSVTANAIDPGFVTDTHVGTQVNIVTDQQNGGTLNKHEGEVLGAATELPDTGANERWLMLAGLLFIAGLGLVFVGNRKRRIH